MKSDRASVKLLEDAAERVYFVSIQREAMQLSYYEKFFEDYGITDEVKKRLGPRLRNARDHSAKAEESGPRRGGIASDYRCLSRRTGTFFYFAPPRFAAT